MGQGVQQALQGGPRGQVHILSRGRSCLKALLRAITPCSNGQPVFARAAWRLSWLGKQVHRGLGGTQGLKIGEGWTAASCLLCRPSCADHQRELCMTQAGRQAAWQSDVCTCLSSNHQPQ